MIGVLVGYLFGPGPAEGSQVVLGWVQLIHAGLGRIRWSAGRSKYLST